MKYFALKSITLDDVFSNYNMIVSNTHFIPEGKTIPEDPNLKEINETLLNVLMLLGVEDLSFLNKVLNSKIEGFLSSDEVWSIYSECDGLGQKTLSELRHHGWDWDHVKNSSPEAIKSAEKIAKEIMVKSYNCFK